MPDADIVMNRSTSRERLSSSRRPPKNCSTHDDVGVRHSAVPLRRATHRAPVAASSFGQRR